jgi:histidinol phosphatase-like enzyme (inositol monophosphatase family)
MTVHGPDSCQERIISAPATISPMRFEKELDVARNVAAQAGRLALEHQAHGFEAESKPDFSPVTSADRASEQLICSLLEEAFPEDGILGEEGAAKESRSGRRWIIDPIDGTRDFVRGIPTWGVLVGLEADGDVLVGACNLPALGDLYSAVRGAGAYRNDAPIRISSIHAPHQAVFCLDAFSNMHRHPFGNRLISWMSQFWAVRSFGGCLDAMCVAAGRAEVWIEGEAKPWDFAALKVIAEEAGARFFNFDGGSSIYGGNGVITVPSLEAEIRNFLGCG